MNVDQKKSMDEIVLKIAEGIWQIVLPQMEVQTANVFLIEDEKLTLIDSGPPYDRCLDVLLEGLRYLGYEWEDIDVVILTHPHIDHIGGVAFLPDSPEIWAYKGTEVEIESYEQYIERWLELPYFNASEYPELSGLFLSKLSLDWIHDFFPRGGSFKISKEFSDGEVLSLGKRELEVIYTPGHSMHHSGLVLRQESLFFSGDYMLPRGPAMTRFMGDQVEVFQTSRKRVEMLDVDRVCPSHGYPFSFESALEKVSKLVRRQEEKLIRALSDSPKLAIDLFVAYFGLKNTSLERMALDFTGVDTFIQYLLKKGTIKKEGQYYLLLKGE
jgi:glyoxylase-like metal-dependent hydrolase (beta-lactamase superfamily II)